ncbi:PKD domain containing protein [Nitzschia inconspicua]|uniref:PKD domain containing protein n=1 Tax=Nitzschia inconspicua TaxID=303405 RepID=A0A9K3LTE8_9STRA|nr:PKD domain containing protein [Nitzschia inconspicua]
MERSWNCNRSCEQRTATNQGAHVFLSILFSFFLVQCLSTVDAAGSVAEGFIDEVVTDTNAMSGTFAPNPRLNNKPMMVLNEKIGRVHILENPDDSPESMLVLDLQDNVCTNGERGLHSIIPHPDFTSNRWMYAFYTKYRQDCLEDPVLGAWNVVVRFTMDVTTLKMNGDEGVEIWRGPPMDKRTHNGGALAFGNDGKLYITTGDGGVRTNSALLSNVHGSILRLNDDGTVPDDNPFTKASGFPNSYRCSDSEGRVPPTAPVDAVCAEIFAYGLRNPFRIAMDPNISDKVRFSIGDVGAQHIEALFYGGSDYKGANYGWPIYEGGVCKPADMSSCDGLSDSDTVTPFHWYEHISVQDGGCVAGSIFVPEGLWPDNYNFLFIDFVFLKVYNLELGKPERGCTTCSPPLPPTRNQTFYRPFRKEEENVNEARMTSMWFGPYKDGMALYLSKYGNKETVVRIRYTGSTNKPPHPLFDFRFETDARVQFDAGRSFDPENDTMTFEWDFGDGSSKVSGMQTLHEYSKSGEYVVTLVVTDSQGQSQQDFKKVKIGEAPSVNIISPSKTYLFSVGESLLLKGEAADASGNLIPEDQLEWEVRQHHADHFHPFLDLKSGNNFELFPAPGPEDFLAATNSFLRVLLTATDTNGLSSTVSVDVQPRMVSIHVHTEPEGMIVLVDEYIIRAPKNISSWVDFDLPLQVEDQPPFLFKTWSDGNQNRTRTVRLLSNAVPQSVTAMFCLDLENMCTTNYDCCSSHCDNNLCKPAPITEAPSESPPLPQTLNSSSFDPFNENASINSSPSIEPLLPPTVPPPGTFVLQPTMPTTTSEIPPFEMDVGQPRDSFEEDRMKHDGGADELVSNDANFTSNESHEKTNLSRNIWFAFVSMIFVAALVACCWCSYVRKRRKDAEATNAVFDSFNIGQCAGKIAEHDEEDDDDIEEGDAMIKITKTGSTHESERSRSESGSSATERWNNTGTKLKHSSCPAAVDLTFTPNDNGILRLCNSALTSDDGNHQDCRNEIKKIFTLTPHEGSVSDGEESTLSEMSSVMHYPVPYDISGDRDSSARLSESSLLLDPSSVSMTGSHWEDLELVASVEKSTESLLSFLVNAPSELAQLAEEEVHISSCFNSFTMVDPVSRVLEGENSIDSLQPLNISLQPYTFTGAEKEILSSVNAEDDSDSNLVQRTGSSEAQLVHAALNRNLICVPKQKIDGSVPSPTRFQTTKGDRETESGLTRDIFFEETACFRSAAHPSVATDKQDNLQLGEQPENISNKYIPIVVVADDVAKPSESTENDMPDFPLQRHPFTPKLPLLPSQPAIAKTFTGATASPTPEKSVSSSNDGVRENDDESSLGCLSPEIVALRLQYNNVDNSLYSL